MKHYYLILASYLFVFVAGQGLFEAWKLDNPSSIFYSESNKFALTYDVSEKVSNNNVKVKIFTASCQNPKDGSEGVEVSDGVTLEKVDAGIFEFALDLPTLIENNQVFDGSNPSQPTIKLCARYMLWLPDGSHEVNFVESILTLYFDLKGADFSFSKFVSKQIDSNGKITMGGSESTEN